MEKFLRGGVIIKKLFTFLLIVLLLSGCQPAGKSQGGTPLPALASAPSSGSSNTSATASSTASSTAPASEPASAPTPAASPAQSPKEADWTLQVNDTIQKNIEGITILYTFTLEAVKHGGTTDAGSYTGTASLKQKMDAGGLSGEIVQVAGGVETDIRSDNVQIDIVSYDREKYDDFGLTDGEPPVSLLTEPDGMALGSITMNGSGKFDVSADAPQNFHGSFKFNKDGTGELSYKLNVEGGQVSVTIPMLNLPDSFNGTITGVPIN